MTWHDKFRHASLARTSIFLPNKKNGFYCQVTTLRRKGLGHLKKATTGFFKVWRLHAALFGFYHLLLH
jgi:hypothetical protein